VILDNAVTIHVISNQSRFVDKLRPSNDFVYTRTGLDPVEGIGTAAIIIQTPSDPRKILLAEAAYIPAFHTNLACLRKFNSKNI